MQQKCTRYSDNSTLRQPGEKGQFCYHDEKNPYPCTANFPNEGREEMEVPTEIPKLQTPEDATYARNRNFKLKEHICTGDTCLLKNEKRKKERKKKKEKCTQMWSRIWRYTLHKHTLHKLKITYIHIKNK